MYSISGAEKQYIQQLLGNATHPMISPEVLAFMQTSEFDEEGFFKHLGVVKLYMNANKDDRFDADYVKFGHNYWRNIQKEIFAVVCENDKQYANERGEIKQGSRDMLVILIPPLIQALGLPAEAAGIAIVIALMIVKVGINSFCNTLQEQITNGS